MKRSLDSEKIRIAVFIVAYNAVNTLRKVLDRIPSDAWNDLTEVYVFDDASTDDTVLLGEGYKSTRGIEKLKIYQNDNNRGYGGNQKLGYDYAIKNKFDYVVLLHGDGQYAPELIPEFIRTAREKKPAAVFGSRMMNRGDARRGGMPRYKYLGNKILTWSENFLMASNLSEFHSGYRMYSVEALKKLHYDSYTDDFHFDTQIIVELLHQGQTIEEIPIPTYYGDEICYVNGMAYAKDVILSVLHYKLFSLGLSNCEWVGEPASALGRYPAKHSPLSSHMRVARLVPADSRVLDVGAEGNYTAMLSEKGCKAVGINNINPESSIESLYESYYIRNIETDGLPTTGEVGKFDCVIIADILEHIRNSEELLAGIKYLLNDSGIVIASTGNVANWYVRFGLLFGRFNYKNRGILDEEHVHLYTRKTFRKLFQKQGYRIRKSKVTPIPFELLAGKGRLTRKFWGFVEYIYYTAARLWPGMFAYQFILTTTPLEQAERDTDS